jgi:hypothetical protein
MLFPSRPSDAGAPGTDLRRARCEKTTRTPVGTDDVASPGRVRTMGDGPSRDHVGSRSTADPRGLPSARAPGTHGGDAGPARTCPPTPPRAPQPAPPAVLGWRWALISRPGGARARRRPSDDRSRGVRRGPHPMGRFRPPTEGMGSVQGPGELESTNSGPSDDDDALPGAGRTTLGRPPLCAPLGRDLWVAFGRIQFLFARARWRARAGT